jgi:hypothetical protein
MLAGKQRSADVILAPAGGGPAIITDPVGVRMDTLRLGVNLKLTSRAQRDAQEKKPGRHLSGFGQAPDAAGFPNPPRWPM